MVKRMRAIATHAAFPWLPLYYLLIVGGGTLLLGWNIPGITETSWPLVLVWLVLILCTDAAPVSLPGGGFITVSSTVDYAGILILGPVPTALAEFVATLILQLYIGNVAISTHHTAGFMASMKTTFLIFVVLCILGVFASLARGKTGPEL